MKAQIAFEYMIIVAIVLAFLAPIWIYSWGVQQQTGTELSLSYAKNTVEKIADTADLVYSQGPPAQVNIQVYIPNGVEEAEIINNTVNLKVRVSSGLSDVWAVSSAALNGSLPTRSGTYTLSVSAQDDLVQITPV